VELHQLDPSVAVPGLHRRNFCLYALEADHAVHPTALYLPFALQREAELGEEGDRGREVIDHDADVVHALDGHVLDGKARLAERYDGDRVWGEHLATSIA